MNDIPRISRRVENRQLLLAFAVPAGLGAAAWLLSRWLTGQREPWDNPGYYLVVMGAAGLAAGAVSRSGAAVPLAYFGVWLGQVLATLTLPHLLSRWSVLVLIVTAIGSVITLVAAALTWAVRADRTAAVARLRKS